MVRLSADAVRRFEHRSWLTGGTKYRRRSCSTHLSRQQLLDQAAFA